MITSLDVLCVTDYLFFLITLTKLQYQTRVKPMNIDEMLEEAEKGKNSAIFKRITKEAEPFWLGCEERVIAGKTIKPYVVSRLLKEHFDVKISETAIRNHFSNLLANNVE